MKILAATDGSRPAESAVRFAAWLASAFPGGKLEVVLVGDVGTELVGQGGGAARVRLVMEEEYRRWARRALEHAARQALRQGVAARCRYVEASLAPIARVISRAADQLRADLIVVGSAGRGAVGRAFFGSVARRLLGLARRPVVVVPAAVTAR
ncbi:MAG: universal stress protein, partial [Thermoanaerobaculia bacterium]